MTTINRRLEKMESNLEILVSDLKELREAVSKPAPADPATYLDPCGCVLPGDVWQRTYKHGHLDRTITNVERGRAYWSRCEETKSSFIAIKSILGGHFDYRLISRPGLKHGGVVKVGDKWQHIWEDKTSSVITIIETGRFGLHDTVFDNGDETDTIGSSDILADNNFVLIHREPEAAATEPSPEDLVGKWFRVEKPFFQRNEYTTDYHKTGDEFHVLGASSKHATVKCRHFVTQSRISICHFANCVEIPAPEATVAKSATVDKPREFSEMIGKTYCANKRGANIKYGEKFKVDCFSHVRGTVFDCHKVSEPGRNFQATAEWIRDYCSEDLVFPESLEVEKPKTKVEAGQVWKSRVTGLIFLIHRAHWNPEHPSYNELHRVFGDGSRRFLYPFDIENIPDDYTLLVNADGTPAGGSNNG